MTPGAKSLILDLLSTTGHAAVPVGSLVRAAALFGIGENAVRVAVARLRAARLVESVGRGRYRLALSARPVQAQVSSWRDLESRHKPWDGGWVAAHTGALSRTDRPALRRRERALRFLGLRTLHPGLELRPDNLRGGVRGVRERLRALGLDAETLVARLDQLDAAAASRALGLWDAPALRAGYRAAVRELDASARRLRSLPREAAMVESFLVGGRAIRQLAFDPLLPEPIVPAAERRRLVDALRRYDRLGRECWNGMLVGAGSERAAPADVRVIAAAENAAGGHSNA